MSSSLLCGARSLLCRGAASVQRHAPTSGCCAVADVLSEALQCRDAVATEMASFRQQVRILRLAHAESLREVDRRARGAESAAEARAAAADSDALAAIAKAEALARTHVTAAAKLTEELAQERARADKVTATLRSLHEQLSSLVSSPGGHPFVAMAGGPIMRLLAAHTPPK